MTREEQIERVWQLLVKPRETDASLFLLAAQIVDALAQPVEITDELAERVCRAFLGSDAISLLKCFDAHGALVKYIYVADGDGLRGMRDALRTALEAGP